ncbi:hypothetical protein [Pigmentiphaga aceris]|uniref:hypothetical protein n=1 Tax=Pigmentiphaga aceris TaxID=1940612 RepID=UPI001FE52068|nr:hypothetical protein [Pigmentiphaga aceris]
MADTDIAPGLGPTRIAVGRHDKHIAVSNGLHAGFPAIMGSVSRRGIFIDPHLENRPAQNFLGFDFFFEFSADIAQRRLAVIRKRVIATARQHDPDLGGTSHFLLSTMRPIGTARCKTGPDVTSLFGVITTRITHLDKREAKRVQEMVLS